MSAATRWGFRGAAGLVYLFLYLPLFLIVLYAFNKTNINSWPFPGFSTRWFDTLAHDQAPKDAAWLSVRVGLFSTVLAVLLGTGMAFAFARHRFFGREGLNFVVTLPIILPGAITGVALASFFLFAGVDLSMRTVIVGHTTFCIVVVFNNVLARLRRVSRSMEEASSDLGASGLQTFRYVTFPMMRGALVAGAILAFALSFDEIVVTTFTAGPAVQTLPIWIFGNLFRPNQAPVINVVAAALTVLAIIPVWLAQRFGGDPATKV